MSKNLMAVISAAIFFLLLFFAIRSWRNRVARQSASISEPLEALEFFGEPLESAKVFYVATTYALNHLERIAAYGLGSRGNAQVIVFTEGILIVRNGERPLAIDKSSIQKIGAGQVAIDKAVEKDGLIQVDWIQDSTSLTTHLRVIDSAERDAIISSISSIIMKEETK
jgi:hypothetical protein